MHVPPETPCAQSARTVGGVALSHGDMNDIVNPGIRKEYQMRVLYINNSGGGWADYIQVPDGQTVERFFAERMPAGKPEDFLIRVNRQPVSRDTVLQENDRVTITPVKVEGAA